MEVDEKGIKYISTDKSESHIPWNEIGEIKQRPTLQKLDIHDKNGNKVLDIPYVTKEFSSIRKEILDNVLAHKRYNLPCSFSKGRIFYVVNYLLILLGIYVAYYFYSGNKSLQLVVMVIIAVLLLMYLLSKQVKTIQITPDRLIVTFIGRTEL